MPAWLAQRQLDRVEAGLEVLAVGGLIFLAVFGGAPGRARADQPRGRGAGRISDTVSGLGSLWHGGASRSQITVALLRERVTRRTSLAPTYLVRQSPSYLSEAETGSPLRKDTPMSRDYDLVGVAEVAALLQVTRRSVARYANRPDFPEPVVRLAAGPIWRRSDVLAWDRRTPRLPGRPRRTD
jgi:predicted DNA-binding transcriptional regulator AlpA